MTAIPDATGPRPATIGPHDPALVEITDRVHRPCKFPGPGSPLSRNPSSSAVVIIFPHWSRPPGFHVCSDVPVLRGSTRQRTALRLG